MRGRRGTRRGTDQVGGADRVTVLVFVNQTTTSTITQGKPRVDLNRARFTMVRIGDRWLVQEIAGL
ncbi:MAG TPA: hypothetical protein VFT31_07930 [Kribbella sp.]|nr:hypothetical protein [Kribbella sp.]